MTRLFLLLLACAALSSTAVAQSDDAAYCAQLGSLALRYTGSAGGNGGTMKKLFSDEQLYDQLVKTVTELNKVLIDVRRDPRRYTKTMIQVKLF